MIRFSKFNLGALIFGYGFLYVPILYLIVYSFNDSRIIGVWAGFSTRWYAKLFQDDALIRAVLNSFEIAAIVATLAVALGTMAAIVMVRFKRFRGKTLFSGLISAPLVMPEVITGLALLLMFVTLERAIGWPSERGMLTIIIAHITLTMSYVYLVIQARLIDFDKSLEEAAMVLGAKPSAVFFKITLPLIFPSLLAGWLLAFALSLDDVVIASFLAGPGATTLPILVFSSVRTGVTPELNALATIIVGIVSIGILISGLIMHRRAAKKIY
jgi:putrescine transport system permease protein